MLAPRPTSVAIAAPLAGLAPAGAVMAFHAYIGALPTGPEAIAAALLVWIMAGVNAAVIGGVIAALVRAFPGSLGLQATGAAGFLIVTALLMVLIGAPVLESLALAGLYTAITIGVAVSIERLRGLGD